MAKGLPLSKKIKFSKKQIAIIAIALGVVAGFALYQAFAATGNSGANERDQANLINDHRQNGHGRAGLGRSSCLTNAAREHSMTMANSNNLHHSDMLNLVAKHCPNAKNGAGARFALGENVGVGQESRQVFNAFLNSSSHHANIDEPTWNLMGTGAAIRDDGSLWITHIFANCSGQFCTSPWTSPPNEIGEPARPTPPPPPPSTSTIQGYKVGPGNNGNVAAASATVVYTCCSPSGNSVEQSQNPYGFNNLPKGNHRVAIKNIPAGWRLLGYTLCFNSTSCHGNTPTAAQPNPDSGAYNGLPSVVINTDNGNADLWWHFAQNTTSPPPPPADGGLLRCSGGLLGAACKAL